MRRALVKDEGRRSYIRSQSEDEVQLEEGRNIDNLLIARVTTYSPWPDESAGWPTSCISGNVAAAAH
jgi:hypothetical protein